MNNWVKVFSTADLFRAQLLKDSLELDGIRCVMLNKMDSAYPTQGIGEVELYVERDNVIKAKFLLSKKDV